MKNAKRLLAVAAIVLLLGIYLLTFIFALGKSEAAGAFFRASLAITIIVPILLYAFLLVAKMVRPSKSALIDAVVFAGPSAAAEDPVLSDRIASLRLVGYSTYIRPEASLEEVRALAREDNLKPSRTFVIADTEENAKLARTAGFPAAVYTDIGDLKEKMKAVGIR